MEKYCKECGQELVNGGFKGFDEETGKIVHYKVCPVGKCGHTGISHNFKLKWGGVFSHSKNVCVDCGFTPYSVEI